MRLGPPAACLIVSLAACRASLPPAASAPAVIRLKGDQDFLRAARAAIRRLGATRTGAALLDELSRAGRLVTVRPGSQDLAGAVIQPLGDGDSLVLWDPEHEREGFPPHVILYHELVHALHEARGGRLPGEAEEEKTAGLGPFAGYPLSENALRRELGLKPRTSTGGTGFD